MGRVSINMKSHRLKSTFPLQKSIKRALPSYYRSLKPINTVKSCQNIAKRIEIANISPNRQQDILYAQKINSSLVELPTLIRTRLEKKFHFKEFLKMKKEKKEFLKEMEFYKDLFQELIDSLDSTEQDSGEFQDKLTLLRNQKNVEEQKISKVFLDAFICLNDAKYDALKPEIKNKLRKAKLELENLTQSINVRIEKKIFRLT